MITGVSLFVIKVVRAIFKVIVHGYPRGQNSTPSESCMFFSDFSVVFGCVCVCVRKVRAMEGLQLVALYIWAVWMGPVSHVMYSIYVVYFCVFL